MDENKNTLSGRWNGRYDYGDFPAPVPFEVVLEDYGGILSGQVTEPNTIRSDLGDNLTASLSGSRTGFEVSFRKFYDGFDQDDDPVYQGQLNTALNRIDGTWCFPK